MSGHKPVWLLVFSIEEQLNSIEISELRLKALAALIQNSNEIASFPFARELFCTTLVSLQSSQTAC